MNKKEYKRFYLKHRKEDNDMKTLKLFQSKCNVNFIIDPSIFFVEIPSKYRKRLFLPEKRLKNDPISIIKEKGKIVLVFINRSKKIVK